FKFSLNIKIQLNEGNNTYNVYDNNTLDQYFYYDKYHDICDCSPKRNYFENVDVNNTKFNITLNNEEEDKIEKIIIKSNNPIIKTNYTIDKENSSDNFLNLNIQHYCQYNNINFLNVKESYKYW